MCVINGENMFKTLDEVGINTNLITITWCVLRINRMAQKFLETWSSQWTCTKMHYRNDSIVVDWSRKIKQRLRTEHHTI